MSKFTIVAEATTNDKGEWGILHHMKDDDMETTTFTVIRDREMAEARSNLFNRGRQHGKAGLKMIGEQAIPNMYVKLA